MEIQCCGQCLRNDDILIPLMWTFVFRGAEWWCPHCGKKYGMFDDYHVHRVDEDNELVKLRIAYEKATKKYLHAMAFNTAISMRYKGSDVPPKDLPDNEKRRLQKIREEWKYGELYKKLKAPSASDGA